MRRGALGCWSASLAPKAHSCWLHLLLLAAGGCGKPMSAQPGRPPPTSSFSQRSVQRRVLCCWRPTEPAAGPGTVHAVSQGAAQRQAWGRCRRTCCCTSSAQQRTLPQRGFEACHGQEHYPLQNGSFEGQCYMLAVPALQPLTRFVLRDDVTTHCMARSSLTNRADVSISAGTHQ